MRNSFPYPKSVPLAHRVSRIEYIERLTRQWNGPEIFIKRDDETSSLLTGNKVRKLEFFMADALGKGADTLITCGGIQSNHARATALAAKRLGLDCHLILRGKRSDPLDGNYLLDSIVGATFTFVTDRQYLNRQQVFDQLEGRLIREQKKPYSIPEGGSSGLGAMGYVRAMEEIRNQTEELGVKFDAIILPVGSGGTYAGLWIGKKFFHVESQVLGINVSSTAQYFSKVILECARDSEKILGMNLKLNPEEIELIDGYVGRGYGKIGQEEISLIEEVAKLEGIILDPVYTGKAMLGLKDQVKKGRFKRGQKVLFIHTGGIFGLFSYREYFKKN